MAAGRYRHGYRIKGRFILILVGLMVLVAALWFSCPRRQRRRSVGVR